MGGKSGMVGPLAAFAPGFAAELVARGYRPGPAADQLRLMAEVSVWLAERSLAAADLTVSVLSSSWLIGVRGARACGRCGRCVRCLITCVPWGRRRRWLRLCR
jgi:hypothetical protein